MKKIRHIIFAFILSITIILGSISFSMQFKPLYYFDIDFLKIEKISNLSKEEIKTNYDYLIYYNTTFKKIDFDLPSINYSVQGKIHFEDVKRIFNTLNKSLSIGFLMSIIFLWIFIKLKEYDFVKYTYILLFLIPICLAIPFAIDFQKSFHKFHEIAFSNDYWIFDPDLDPIINILPEEFFFHEAILILSIIFISSLMLQFIYVKLKT